MRTFPSQIGLALMMVALLAGFGAVPGSAQGRQRPAAPPAAPQPVSVADLATPDAPITIGDPKLMPDIVGIHLHMTLAAATAALRAQYPGRTFGVHPTEEPTIAKPITTAIVLNQVGGFDEQVTMDFTLLPSEQRVWRVHRLMPGPKNRAAVIAALRAKYGKETFALSLNGAERGDAAATDTEIAHMYWLFDQSGKRAPAPRAAARELAGCAIGDYNPVSMFLQWDGKSALAATFSPFAQSSCIVVYALLNPGTSDDAVYTMSVTMTDVPLILQASKASAVWRAGVLEKLRQEELVRSKKNTPKF